MLRRCAGDFAAPPHTGEPPFPSTAWQANANTAQGEELGPLGAALVDMRAARVEGAARRRVQRVGHLALHWGARLAGVMHLGDGVSNMRV